MVKTKKVKRSKEANVSDDILSKTYPRIYELGIKVIIDPISYVPSKELGKALKKAGITKKFSEYYGCQTRYIDGPYPWDVEAVLERIYSGKLKGSQLDWD